MQRVAQDLHQALEAHPEVELETLALRVAWKDTAARVPGFLVRAGRRIWNASARGEFDRVLFSSMVTASLATTLGKRMSGAAMRSATIAHGLDVTTDNWVYQTMVVPRIFSALDTILPVSQATAQACRTRGCDMAKIHVVPNGIDAGRFKDADASRRREELRGAFGESSIDDDHFLLCSVGRQVRRKGFAWFVKEVMPLLHPDVHYWMAGEGPEAQNIRDAARSAGVQDRVRLLGRVSDTQLRALYGASDLFAMPNVHVQGDMEGFGVVMLEAGLFGLPTVGADLEGIRDVIEEGRNGHRVQPENPEAFRQVIEDYRQNPRALETLRDTTRVTVLSKFSWNAVANRYVDALR